MIDLAIDGVLRGGIYATAAVGYVILYRSIKVINLAYGAMALLAAYLYWMLTPQLPPLLGFLAILPVMALLAVVADKAVVRPMLGEPVIQIIAATIGLGYLIKGALLLVLQLGYALPGYQQVPYETPLLPRGFVELGALRLDLNFLGAFLASIVAFLLLWVFYKKTSLGIAMRAMSNDRPSAVAFGVRPTEAITTSWILAGLLAAISGVFYAGIFGGPSGSVGVYRREGSAGYNPRRLRLGGRRAGRRRDSRARRSAGEADTGPLPWRWLRRGFPTAGYGGRAPRETLRALRDREDREGVACRPAYSSRNTRRSSPS
jgi:branched-chain amino acid transport system permease protein